MPLALALLGIAALVQGCARQDSERVVAFNEQYAKAVEMQERTLAASYPYQLAETPESETVNRVFGKIRTRSASRADFEEALAAERERGWYLDHFEAESKAFGAAIGELRRRADAITDRDVRQAATKLCGQLSATLERAMGLLAAQRERSGHVVVFFTELISRERRFPRLAELEATGEQLQRLRDAMIRTVRDREAIFDTFRNLVEGKLGLRLPPKSLVPSDARPAV